MSPAVFSYAAAIVMFIVSALLSAELAWKRGRDGYFYFFAGLVLGPVALAILLTPLPGERARGKGRAARTVRHVEGRECPECHRKVEPMLRKCPHCSSDLTVPWWERVDINKPAILRFF